MLLGPTTVETKLCGKRVKILCNTAYPFSDTLSYSIEAEDDFDFAIRIPSWSTNGTIETEEEGSHPTPLHADISGLYHVPIKRGSAQITVKLSMDIYTVIRDGSIGIYHGPLLYALEVEHTSTTHQPLNWTDRTPLNDSETHPHSHDYVLEPTQPWNYAVDPSTIRVEYSGKGIRNPVWANGGSPTSLTVDGYPIPWSTAIDSADIPPENPVVKRADRVPLKLIPFGAAKLHMAQFPVAVVED
jgi:hypothetical protein